MKIKNILSMLIIFFSLAGSVFALPGLDILTYSQATPLEVAGQEKDVLTATIKVNNTGTTNLSLTASEFLFNSNNFKDSDGDIITLTFSDIQALLTPGSVDDITLTVNIANKVDLDTYSGIIELKDVETGANDTFKLEVIVQPEVCEDGIRKDGNTVDASSAWLQLDIDNPDNNDEFAPGEAIDIEITVDNDNDDAMDVVVEAFLYNLDEDDEIERVKSESKDIDDGDDESFDLELVVPLEDLDEDDEYVLFIKAYEDGDEDENCNEDSIDIDVEREDHQVIIDKDLTISPSVLSCVETASFSVPILNIGKKDEEDVFVELKQPELGLDERSDLFDIDKDDDAVKRFTFTIPEDAEEKEYTVEATVTFDDGDDRESKFGKLKVENCFIEPEYLQGSLSIGTFTVTKTQASIPVIVTNQADQAGRFDVEVTGVESWANPVEPRAVTLQPGQSTTIFFYPQLREDLPEVLTAVVNLLSNSNLVDSKSAEKTLEKVEKAEEKEEAAPTTAGILDLDLEGTNAFWIIADIVLIILAVLLVRALFTRRK